MHVGHVPGRICYALAAETELKDGERLGLFLHELGHLIADKLGWPEHKTSNETGMQVEADLVVVSELELQTYTYDENEVEWIDPLEVERRLQDAGTVPSWKPRRRS